MLIKKATGAFSSGAFKMQIKHTFLFMFFLAVSWVGYLFGNANGPALISNEAVSGVFGPTCSQSGCHVGNPPNAAGGSVSISGLPTDTGWTAGQTYPLTITVQRTAQRTFGFQLSAVSDASVQQAGTFTLGAGIHSKSIGGIVFVEHSFPKDGTGTASFGVSWTAPSTTSGGTVRFNVAGNAANRDGNNTGDFIYTQV